MAMDMKEVIAEAARKLLFEKNVKRLTVKEIVAECGITRQTFYYHFEDIPALVQWEMERNMNKILEKAREEGTLEDGLRYLFLVALNASPYVKKGMESNYREDMVRLLAQYLYRLFEQIVEDGKLYQNYGEEERKLILRYHSQAVMGLLRTWTREDTENLDRIVHQVYLLMTGQVSPFAGRK